MGGDAKVLGCCSSQSISCLASDKMRGLLLMSSHADFTQFDCVRLVMRGLRKACTRGSLPFPSLSHCFQRLSLGMSFA